MRKYAPYLKDRDREGKIEPGDVAWFPKEDWFDHSFIWGKRDAVWVSAVHARSPKTGALSRLFEAIHSSGRKIVVPTPLHVMRTILEQHGFDGPFLKRFGQEAVEIWIKDVPDHLKHQKKTQVDKALLPRRHSVDLQGNRTGWQKSAFGVYNAQGDLATDTGSQVYYPLRRQEPS